MESFEAIKTPEKRENKIYLKVNYGGETGAHEYDLDVDDNGNVIISPDDLRRIVDQVGVFTKQTDLQPQINIEKID